ncbi:hypothetical protein AVEN_250807-1 [Araneus ventricosus]|uniref:Transposase Tc1-like domain-containing protein n=1 Tax=Araneus ventricosus TaxID=182803 RepID=A0A4Y2IU89_ARAVE|nr:hypothetical protein AVEN_250807-1 [Araneus ventricosus]
MSLVKTQKAINDRGEHRLRRLVKSDRHATVDTLTAQMNQQCSRKLSRTTLQRTLLRIDFRSRRLISEPMLTSLHRKKRRAFTLQHKHWTLEQWEKVGFQMSLVSYCIRSMGPGQFVEWHQKTYFLKPLLGANKMEDAV